jgi:preprotein translocase subunit YajC
LPTAIILPVHGLIAQAGTTPTTAPSQAPWYVGLTQNPMILMVLLLMVFMFLMSSSKKKQERQKQEQLNKIKRGDRVQTIGGILGKVVEADDAKVLLKVDESSNTKIWFSRSAIHRVLGEEKTETK